MNSILLAIKLRHKEPSEVLCFYHQIVISVLENYLSQGLAKGGPDFKHSLEAIFELA